MEKTRKKNMVMTNEDIVRSYKEAKDKRAQIKVLAELNVCPQELIIEILKEGGVDWRELPRQRKKSRWGGILIGSLRNGVFSFGRRLIERFGESGGSRQGGVHEARDAAHGNRGGSVAASSV